MMTEAEYDEMHEVGERFWLEFSALCKRYLDAAPAKFRAEYEMFLGEKTSIYGRQED
jgi:hypothetical protein